MQQKIKILVAEDDLQLGFIIKDNWKKPASRLLIARMEKQPGSIIKKWIPISVSLM